MTSGPNIRIEFFIVFLMASAATFADETFEKQADVDAAGNSVVVVVPPSDGELVIDLETALRLAQSQNPRMALAREVVNEAMAQHKATRALLLPSLAAGGNYHFHTGVLQSSSGEIRSVTGQSLYVGGGAGAIGSNTVAIPAVRIFAQVGDAFYLPLAAKQSVTARVFDSHAVDNLTLLDVADRYLTLVAAEARRESLRVSLREVGEVEKAQREFERAGEGRDADYRRARADFLLLQLDEQQAQEDAAVAAAELSRLLHLDPSIRLVTPNGPIELLELVDRAANAETLIAQALSHRPEVTSRSAEIGAAEYRYRNERMRPWLPQVSAGFSGGALGGGSNRQDLGVPSMFATIDGRTDLDLWAIWTIQNLGAGNNALQGIGMAAREQTVFQRAMALAQIRREVEERQAQTRSRRRTIAVSFTQLASAERGAQQELRRSRSGDGVLPLESLNSILLLANARLQLLNAVIEYNRAELRLYVALGTSPANLNAAVGQTSMP